MKSFIKKFPKALRIFNLSWISFFFVATFIFDFDNSIRGKRRRACDQYIEESISFTQMKELWKPQRKDYQKGAALSKRNFDDDYQKWNSWERLSDTVSHPRVGKNICNYNRYNRGSNLQALFTIFGIAFLLFLLT